MAKLKRRMLFSEKEKLAVKYEQWCNQIDEKLNNAKLISDFESERVWGEKRECDGKMIALQDLMTRIDELAKEYSSEEERK